MRSSLRTYLLGLIALGGFILLSLLLVAPWSSASEEVIVATANNNVQITKEQLDRVINNYQLKSQKPVTTIEEKIKLIPYVVDTIRSHLQFFSIFFFRSSPIITLINLQFHSFQIPLVHKYHKTDRNHKCDGSNDVVPVGEGYCPGDGETVS